MGTLSALFCSLCVLQLEARPARTVKIISWDPLLPASLHFMKNRKKTFSSMPEFKTRQGLYFAISLPLVGT